MTVQGRLGFLSQDPRSARHRAAGTGLAHILSGRGLDEAADRPREAADRHGGAPLGTGHRPLRPSRGRLRVARRLRRRVRGAPARRRAWAWAPIASTCPSAVLSGGERRRVELARILFAGSDVLLLDEPTNHLDSDAKNWLMGFLRAYRGALLVVSHDLDLLDEAITRVLHLDEAQLVEYKGTYSQYRAGPGRGRGPAGASWPTRQQAEIKRLSTPGRLHAPPDGQAGPGRQEPRQAGRPPAGRRRRPDRAGATAATRCKFPVPPHTGRLVLEADGLAKAYGGPPVFEDVSFAVERGERLLIMGLNGAGKTSLLRILAGWSEPTAGTWRTGVGVSAWLLRPGARRHPRRGSPSWTTSGTRLDSHRDETAGRCSGCSGWSATWRSRTPAPCRAARRPSWRWPSWSPGRHNLLLLDEPTNNLDPPVPRGHRPGAGGLAGHHDPGQPRRRVRHRARARPGAAHARRHRGPLERRLARPGGDGVMPLDPADGASPVEEAFARDHDCVAGIGNGAASTATSSTPSWTRDSSAMPPARCRARSR